ncbi:dihydropyrimidinase [Alphaproteobacteria bacterium GH1-50]|uniref:Dihydropyrimidinase n=1 Tax=Kangsaoukella pontilimi TaxID=2691042 RepID=A0A7C9MPB2_9RHOB|nr:dihydropyrimidinase [Kangsaoukella pontilimi]MXQ06297.1 dihydropyrimidinase [Kangsaoukella pontilimi]
MSRYDLILTSARVLTATHDGIADIGIRDGKIAALGDLSGAETGDRRDLTGKVVTPGGVDVHCHIEQMSGMGLMNADTFETATRSAAIGGTTSVISFAAQARGQRLSDAMSDYASAACRGAMIDHAFHMIVADMSVPSVAEDMRRLIGEGHRSIKVFTTYNIQLSDREICEVIGIAREAGALVCIHAENDGLIGWTKERLVAAGKHAPRYHAVSHPRLAEIEAVERMIRFAEFFATPLMLFHISTREALDAIRAAKARGVPVWAETCPHYLMMAADFLDRDGIEGAKWMCSPPQRATDDQVALWEGLGDGTLSLVSSDHAPYRFDETGKLSQGRDVDFSKIANGLPGLEVRMPLLFDEIVSKGRLPATEFARLTATEPARLYGLSGKGDIAEGFDADLVVWGPYVQVTYGPDDLNDNVGYNPWEGRTVTGWPEMTLLRGKVVAEAGAVRAEPGTGRWIDRPAIGAATDRSPAPEYTEATMP